MRLSALSRCFQGVIPSIIASSDAKGLPNVTYVSQVHLVSETQVALSRQFFNKTRKNLDENPFLTAEVTDPVTMQAYRLRLRFVRSEKEGPLFDTMSLRIQAIASHTGMDGVFRLRAADVFDVLSAERVEGFLTDGLPAAEAAEVSLTGVRTELRGLQLVSERINRAEDLDTLLAATLDALAVFFGFEHTIVLLWEEELQKLVTIACRGYGGGVGAEVAPGEGLIGTVARERRVLRMTGLDEGLRYGRAIREAVLRDSGQHRPVRPEIPLPGLADAQSALVIPLTVEDRLIGVIAAESRDPLAFGEWDEAYFGIIANQIALGIDRVADSIESPEREAAHVPRVQPPAPRPRHTLTYFREDDSVFLDDDYLIRNVPGRILWKLLSEWRTQGRTAFTNRELRLDRSLGLPEIKDNLESRLILLKNRLREKCPEMQITSTGRGRFALEIGAEIEMVER